MNLKVLPADQWRIHPISADVVAIGAHTNSDYLHWTRIETKALAEWLSVWSATEDGDGRPATPKDICPA
jgi:hypothetical protein